MVTGVMQRHSLLITQNVKTKAHNWASLQAGTVGGLLVFILHSGTRHKKRKEMPTWREQKVQREGCNRAVVVSVAQFDPGVSLGRRPGAKKDNKKLHSTLSKVGFKVDLYMDLTADEIYELFQKGAGCALVVCMLWIDMYIFSPFFYLELLFFLLL